jgi:hypothetical protein
VRFSRFKWYYTKYLYYSKISILHLRHNYTPVCNVTHLQESMWPIYKSQCDQFTRVNVTHLQESMWPIYKSQCDPFTRVNVTPLQQSLWPIYKSPQTLQRRSYWCPAASHMILIEESFDLFANFKGINLDVGARLPIPYHSDSVYSVTLHSHWWRCIPNIVKYYWIAGWKFVTL